MVRRPLLKIDRSFLTSTLFISLAVGIAARFILMPITSYEYDSYFWGTVVQNINSGNGLYELMGYYYTPLWGYYVGFMDMIWNTLLSMDVIGIRFTDLLGIESLGYSYHRATIVTPFFNVLFKTPLVICDIIVGYLLYRMVKTRTSDRKKAEFAFALWFLCPVLIYMSGIQPMFDTFSALFTVLCIILLMNRADLLGGVMFAAATMLKIFPALILPIIIVYLIKSSDDKDTRIRRCAVFLIGTIVTSVLIMLPNIIQGNVADTLYFLVGRVGSYNSALLIVAGLLMTVFAVFSFVLIVKKRKSKGFMVKYICAVGLIALIGLLLLSVVKGGGISGGIEWLSGKTGHIEKLGSILIAVLLEFVLALLFFLRDTEDVDDQMMVYVMCGLTATVGALLVPAPQYCIVLIPFLAYHIAVRDRGFMILWLVLGVVTVYKNLISNNFGLLTTLSEYFNVFSSDWILSCMRAMDTEVMGTTLQSFLDYIGTLIYRIALIGVFIFSAEDLLKRWPRSIKVIHAVKSFGHRGPVDDE